MFASPYFRMSLAFGAVAALSACTTESAPKTVEDTARGCRYVVPPGWKSYDGEVRSGMGTLVTIRDFDLEGGQKAFVDGLPETIIPQLEEWAKSVYMVEGPPTRAEGQVGGFPALELNYTVRARAQSPPTKLIYWVVPTKKRLFVLRVSYPQQAIDVDEPVIREMLASWSFPGAEPR